MRLNWSARDRRPSKVIGVRRTFAGTAGAKDEGEVAEPRLFIKPSTAVIEDGEPIGVPAGVHDLVAEVELGLVVGVEAREVPLDDVRHVIRGVVCANDVTAVDVFQRDQSRAKGMDGFCPLGTDMADVSVLDQGVTLRTFVNGVLRQEGHTRDMSLSAEALVSFVSRYFTLLPDDVLLLGTPPNPPHLAPGDVVRVEASGIGSITNPVVLRGSED